MAASIDFRPDINGLRAYAVAAVVLYHFGVPGFAGGFVGVDVFFVISGFLMTGIIVSQLEAGRFSLLGFYLARAARIIPALAALCAAVLVFGWFWLTPVDYQRLGRHTASSIAFLSNVTYATESGYFDTAAHTCSPSPSWGWRRRWPSRSCSPPGARRTRSTCCPRARGSCWPAAPSFSSSGAWLSRPPRRACATSPASPRSW